jgi:hypothetical protein
VQHRQLLAGALLGLVVLVVVVGVVLRRAPFLLVADALPGRFYGGADDVGELLAGADEAEAMAREGVDATELASPPGDDAGDGADEGHAGEMSGREGDGAR